MIELGVASTLERMEKWKEESMNQIDRWAKNENSIAMGSIFWFSFRLHFFSIPLILHLRFHSFLFMSKSFPSLPFSFPFILFCHSYHGFLFFTWRRCTTVLRSTAVFCLQTPRPEDSNLAVVFQEVFQFLIAHHIPAFTAISAEGRKKEEGGGRKKGKESTWNHTSMNEARKAEMKGREEWMREDMSGGERGSNSHTRNQTKNKNKNEQKRKKRKEKGKWKISQVIIGRLEEWKWMLTQNSKDGRASEASRQGTKQQRPTKHTATHSPSTERCTNEKERKKKRKKKNDRWNET